jgi:threonylcarbamoyladenosine tRNA methylthiotransferase MtaB
MKLTKFKIITFGCRVNQAESRMLGEELVRNIRGIKSTKSIKGVDLVILNTCCVTVKAEKEVRQTIRRIKKDNPKCFLIVTGCWVDRFRAEVGVWDSLRSPVKNYLSLQSHANKLHQQTGQRRDALKTKTKQFLLAPRESHRALLKNIDLLVSNKGKAELAGILREYFNHLAIQPFSHLPYRDKYANDKKTIIKIQDGCNNFCTYCIVPYVRGRSISRPVEEIIKEIKQKEKEGIKEVILTGIDLEDYKFKVKSEKLKVTVKNLKLNELKNNLVKLIKLILFGTKIKKISFGSMGWKIINKEFYELFNLKTQISKVPAQGWSASGGKTTTQNLNLLTINNRVSTHFHIPLQSGCNGTLKRMNRRYKVKDIRHKIYELKKNVPNFTFSTDLIVGFPGETEEEFKQTLEFITEIKKVLGKSFTKAHIFRYSSRPGTVAAKMESTFAKASADKSKQGWEKIEEGKKQNRTSLLQAIFN